MRTDSGSIKLLGEELNTLFYVSFSGGGSYSTPGVT